MPPASSTMQGSVALVTGASSGIGAATARRLARAGLKVVLAARRADRLERLAAEIGRAGGEAQTLVADLSCEAERVRVIDEARAIYGAVDVLVNNAGFGWYGFAADMPWALARQMVEINTTAAVHLTLLVLPHMRERRAGHIVNVSSIAGSIRAQGVALYGATKCFLDTFSIALYRELRGTGVHVSLVRAGPVRETGFYDTAARLPAGSPVPAERFGTTPDAVAGRIYALLRCPRKQAYVPAIAGTVPAVELLFGWALDLFGPVHLRHLAGRGGHAVPPPDSQ